MKTLKKVTILIVPALALFCLSGLTAEEHRLSGKRVAVLLADQFQDAEALAPIFHLREYGVESVVIGIEKGRAYAYNSDVAVTIKKTVDEVSADDFDALIIPGGGSPAKLRENEAVISFVQSIAANKKPIAAICHGPQVLARAGLVKDARVTAFPGIEDEMKEAGATFVDEEVVLHEWLITSRLPKDIPAFNRAIVQALKAGQ